MISEMTVETAQQLFAHIVSQRNAGGMHYRGDDVGIHKIIDAIVVIAHHGNKADADLRAQLTLANRQLGAYKARDAKKDRKELGFTMGEGD
jgi:hypothetical protein